VAEAGSKRGAASPVAAAAVDDSVVSLRAEVDRGSSPPEPCGHGPDGTCVKCTGFQPGHELSLRHGAYSTVKLGPRVDELADLVRQDVGSLYRPSDEIMIRLLALVLARIEAAARALETADGDSLQRLAADARGWVNTARRIANDLGLSPTARGKLGLDVALARRAAGFTATTLPDRQEGAS
jgi:hypothetical protein